MKLFEKWIGLSVGLVIASLLLPVASHASLIDALKDGQSFITLRYRYEFVDQDGLDDNANASTLKTALGYKTGDYFGFVAMLEFENTSAIGDQNYNDTINGKSSYPVVADPEHSEINQAYLAYSGLEKTTLKLGRRRIILDNARFIGNVGWRQAEQTYDALSIKSTIVPNTTLYYAYIQNVNRIFTDRHPAKSDLRMNSHLLNIAYSGMKWVKITGYAYLFDFDDLPDNSMKTFGIRMDGSAAISDAFKLLYTGEYASQSDYADGAATIDADYFRCELGFAMKMVSAKVGYELLEGDGTYGFSTPLATLHAFNGWADKFLGTPADGLQDLFFQGKFQAKGFKLLSVYHIFSSDEGSYDYGTELDIVLSKKLGKNYLVGAKYASYYADDNPNNSGAPSVDTDKIWFFMQLKF